MDFADFDLVRAEILDGLRRFFKFDRQMAGVVIDSQVFFEPPVLGPFLAHLLEKQNCFRAGFQVTEWFRLESEMEFSSRPLTYFGHVLNALPKIGPYCFHLLLGLDEFLKRARDGADAALDSGRRQLRQQIEEAVRKFQPLASRPVRHIDLFLHPRAVKAAIRKAVDREYIALILLP